MQSSYKGLHGEVVYSMKAELSRSTGLQAKPKLLSTLSQTGLQPTPRLLMLQDVTMGLNLSFYNWILDFLMGRPQVVKVSNNISATLTFNTGASRGCVLSPLQYSLFTHDCVATHDSNTIIKVDDDTTVVGLITDDDETAYRVRGQ